MSAVKSNKLAESPHARIISRRPVRISSNASYRFQRSEPEQAIDKRRCIRMINHEPVVSRQRHPKSSEVREVSRTVA
jgi:hypothetical protein